MPTRHPLGLIPLRRNRLQKVEIWKIQVREILFYNTGLCSSYREGAV